MHRSIRVARATWTSIAQDRVLTYAGAIAFYTALSLPPLVVVLLWILGVIGAGSEQYLRDQAELLIGDQGRELVDSLLENADERVRLDGIPGILSTFALLFAASGVFAQLQLALNTAWDVVAKPGAGIVGWLRKRLLSFGILGVLAFLMLVSLAASALVEAVGLAGNGSAFAEAVNWLVSIGVFTLLFAAVYKLLPDVSMRWRDVWLGAGVTAVLFAVGKWGIGLYLAHKGLGSQYGAAGSTIVVLAWVYYSAAIVLVGAEVTQALMQDSGRRIEPNAHAVRAPSVAEERPARD